MSAEIDVVLGMVYRDTITGFTGTATAHAHYLGGTPEVRLEAHVGPIADEKARWVKVTRIEEAPPPSGPGFS